MATGEASQVVLTQGRGRAMWISINREQRRNAINPEVIAAGSSRCASFKAESRSLAQFRSPWSRE